MDAVVWNDYVCPWAYLGRDRTATMEAMGWRVERRPFELHPELTRPSRPVRPDGRLAAVFERVEAECAEAGLAFSAPSSSPNTRLALELGEVVRSAEPAAFTALDDALFAARFTEDRDLADPGVLADILVGVGLDPRLLAAAQAGAGRDAVDASIAEARSVGATATPTWRFEGGFVLTGIHPSEQVRRWLGRIEERFGGAGRITPDG